MASSCPLLESSMPHYAALDGSNEQTAIHVVDKAGRTVWRGKRASDPEALAEALRRHAPDLVRVGLETGFLTPWLYHSLKAVGLPVVCLEAAPPELRPLFSATRRMPMTPRPWPSSCAQAGIGRRASKASRRMPCATWSAPGPSSKACGRPLQSDPQHLEDLWPDGWQRGRAQVCDPGART